MQQSLGETAGSEMPPLSIQEKETQWSEVTKGKDH